MEPIYILIETGKRRTFASALDWPGWSRSGRDEELALQALVEYGPRYAQVIRRTPIEFQPPADWTVLEVLERLVGDATTDFGAPSIIAEADKRPFDQAGFERSSTLLQACWDAFEHAVQEATGKQLRTGPRGGGRDLRKIKEHVLGAEQGYLRSLAWKMEKYEERNLEGERKRTRAEILNALERAFKEGLPEQGPRGGKVWPPRYFVRRTAWHVLDHAWELEDRVV